VPNNEPGRRIELLSPDYKAGALPLSYPGQLDLCGATDNSMPEAGDRRHGIGRAPHWLIQVLFGPAMGILDRVVLRWQGGPNGTL
jgi:hypothetical protein